MKTTDAPELLPRPRVIDLGDDLVDAEGIERRVAIPGRGLPPQGYRFTIGARSVDIEAADAAGAAYADRTLDQLVAVHRGRLPMGFVEDWPDLPVRGVMLDVSRDKVPTIETLEALVDRLASLKVNHLQLYMEHTFAYAGHQTVWADASPFTPDEIVHLDRYCAERHIELAPNQNCLGHMERWLRHERYRPLAIAPDGFDMGSRWRPPTTIDPGHPESLLLARDLLGQLTACFTSRRVHVGLDEPWELPDDRASDYLAYIRALRAAPELQDREMLMWGDIVARHPEQVDDLPEGVTVCEWGYEADHPFSSRAAWLAEAGRSFWVCPGTSSWNSIVGRATNAVANIAAAARAGAEHGAGGLLVTDWGDNGHVQYLPVSEPLFAWTAAMSWCADANAGIDLAAAASRHVFQDDSGELASALLALGDLHRRVRPQLPNMSILAVHLYAPRYRMGEGRTGGLTDADLVTVDHGLHEAAAAVARARLRRGDAELITSELATSIDLLRLLVADARARLAAGGRVEDVDQADRRRLAAQLDGIVERHRQLWLARNRPGGLPDSVARFERLREVYVS